MIRYLAYQVWVFSAPSPGATLGYHESWATEGLGKYGGEASGLAMVNRERILAGVARYVTVVGMILPAAYVAPIALFEISGYFGRLEWLAWMSDLAMLLSVPWELIATVLIILRWRDLPQRFWITYCVNGLLAYLSLPIYRMHFGLYR